jgi:hypothetical protein
VAKVEKDMAYINKHGFKGSLLDEIVVATMTNVEGISQSFFNNLTTFLVSANVCEDVFIHGRSSFDRKRIRPRLANSAKRHMMHSAI